MRASFILKIIPVLFLLLASCARLNSAAVISSVKADPSAGAYIEGVPFFAQDELMCGPAALASVIGYWGKTAGMEDVAAKVYHERLKGTLPLDMLIYAKEAGFEAEYFEASIDELKKRLSEGTPVILFLNLGYDFYPVGHYIVAVGYSDHAGAVLAHSGMNREEAFSYERLTKAWSKTGYSTLLIKPKKVR